MEGQIDSSLPEKTTFNRPSLIRVKTAAHLYLIVVYLYEPWLYFTIVNRIGGIDPNLGLKSITCERILTEES